MPLSSRQLQLNSSLVPQVGHWSKPADSPSIIQQFAGVFSDENESPAGCTLATGFMLVEVRQPGNGINDICRFVHDNHSRSAEPALLLLEGIKVHELCVTNVLWQQGNRRSTCGRSIT